VEEGKRNCDDTQRISSPAHQAGPSSSQEVAHLASRWSCGWLILEIGDDVGQQRVEHREDSQNAVLLVNRQTEMRAKREIDDRNDRDNGRNECFVETSNHCDCSLSKKVVQATVYTVHVTVTIALPSKV